jgi:peroxiredoxin
MSVLPLTLSLIVGILSFVCYQLGLQIGRLALRLDSVENALRANGTMTQAAEEALRGLHPGSLVRDFELPLVGGGAMTLSQWAGRRVLIAFVHPDCSFSRGFLSHLPPPMPDRDPVTLIVSTGAIEKSERMVTDHRIEYPVLVQEQDELSSLFDVRGTPMGYVIDAAGRTEGELRIGSGGLLAALGVKPQADANDSANSNKSVPGSRLLRTGLTAGTPAPDFTLPQLNGSELSLRDLLGRRVLLVFSDPNCGPCQMLAPELETVHRRAHNLDVVMISRGDIEANRAKVAEHRLTFPIALQRHWEISRAYGMFATPIAYLIGKDGVVSHNVAVGGEAILRLADL